MARVAEHVTAVDFFDAPHVEFYGDYAAEFDQSIERHGVAHKVTKQRPEDAITGEFDFVFIDGANHVSFGGTGADAITAVVKATTSSFWDAYLKDSPAAKAALKNASVLESWKPAARISCK